MWRAVRGWFMSSMMSHLSTSGSRTNSMFIALPNSRERAAARSVRQQALHLAEDELGRPPGAQPVDEIHQPGIGAHQRPIPVLLLPFHDDLRRFARIHVLDRAPSVGLGQVRVETHAR